MNDNQLSFTVPLAQISASVADLNQVLLELPDDRLNDDYEALLQIFTRGELNSAFLLFYYRAEFERRASK